MPPKPRSQSVSRKPIEPFVFPSTDPLKQILHEHLEFDFGAANRSVFVGPFTTGMRNLPEFVCAFYKGPWRLRINNGPLLPMRDGGCILGSNTPHEIAAAPGEHFDCVWLHGRFRLFGSIELTSGRSLTQFSAPLDQWLRRMCLSMAVAMTDPKVDPFAAVARTRALGFEMLERIREPMELGNNMAERLAQSERLTPVIDHIRRHLAQPIRRDELAAMAHLSPTWFHTLFFSMVGQTPMAFANQQRMLAARTLLISTDLPIKTIAGKTTPFDIFHFSRVFKAAYGMSPKEYRIRHHKGRIGRML